jgi:hypothetical protein
MGQLIIKCDKATLLDKEKLEKAVLEAAEGFTCNIDYYDQAQAMVNAGTAKSERDASKQIAQVTGEKPETVRKKVQRGKNESGDKVSPFVSKVENNKSQRNKRITITVPYDLYLWLESYSSDFHASIDEGVRFLLEESQSLKEYKESLEKELEDL